MFLKISGGLLALIVLAIGLYPFVYSGSAEKRFPPIGRIIPVSGGNAHVWEAGPAGGAPVLFIHGASSNVREWAFWLVPQMNKVAPELRALTIDRPGHGHSDRVKGAEQLAVQARFMAEILAREAPGMKAVVVGHSYGGAVALRLAIDRPDLVKGVVLLSPASHPYPGPNAWYVRAANHPIFGRLFAWAAVPALGPAGAKGGTDSVFAPQPAPEGYSERLGLPLLFRPSNFAANAADIGATKQEFAAQKPLYPGITARVVIFSTDTDKVLLPRLHAEALAREIPGARLVVVEGGGHMPHHRDAPAVIAAIRALAQ